MAPPVKSVVMGEYGDIVAQKCGTCHKVQELAAYACDHRNKVTGRQRRCRKCFSVMHKKRAIIQQAHKKDRGRCVEGVVVAPHIRDRIALVARALGVTEGVYVAKMVTMWAERDWDSEYERQLETEALAALGTADEQVPEDDYITVEDRVSAMLRQVEGK